MKDDNDKTTVDLFNKRRLGRPAKIGEIKTSAERQREYRERERAKKQNFVESSGFEVEVDKLKCVIADNLKVIADMTLKINHAKLVKATDDNKIYDLQMQLEQSKKQVTPLRTKETKLSKEIVLLRNKIKQLESKLVKTD